MTFLYENADIVGSGTAVTMVANDVLLLTAGHTLASTGTGNGIATSGFVKMTIYGSVQSIGDIGIRALTGVASVTIGDTGDVWGGTTGIAFTSAGAVLNNHGAIAGQTHAIQFLDQSNVLLNDGTISATLDCVTFGGGNNKITNAGTISSSDGIAIQMATALGQTDVITNTGTIMSGVQTAITSGQGSLTVHNMGTIVGSVVFSFGNDLYDGGDGKLIGAVSGAVGNDVIRTGAGAATLSGGAGADTLESGGGHDVLAYGAASESNGSAHDRVLDFDAQRDVFDLNVVVTGIDAAIHTGTLNAASFGANLGSALGSLGLHHAVLFTADAGDLAGHTILVVDANNKVGFQGGHDYAIDVTDATNLAHFAVDNFI